MNSNSQLFNLSVKSEDIFYLIGGMRKAKITVNNEMIEANNVSSGAWRSLQNQSGINHLMIEGQGIFLNTQVEKIVSKLAFTSSQAEFKLELNNQYVITGDFLIHHYELSSVYHNEQEYSIVLQSSGPTIHCVF